MSKCLTCGHLRGEECLNLFREGIETCKRTCTICVHGTIEKRREDLKDWKGGEKNDR